MFKISLDEFLNLIKVVKMLYGREIAITLFEKNINTYIRNYETKAQAQTNKEGV